MCVWKSLSIIIEKGLGLVRLMKSCDFGLENSWYAPPSRRTTYIYSKMPNVSYCGAEARVLLQNNKVIIDGLRPGLNVAFYMRRIKY